MSEFNPLTGQRLALLTFSGFDSSGDALQAVAEQVDTMCSDLIEQQQTLNEVQQRRLKKAELSEIEPSQSERLEHLHGITRLQRLQHSRNTIPAMLGTYWGLLLRSSNSEEEVENALFLLARMADDLIQISALYMVGKTEENLPKPITVSEAGGVGGRTRGENAQATAQAHKDNLAPIFTTLRQANPSWLDAALIREAVKVYGKRVPALPGERQLTNYLAELIEDRRVPRGAKDGRAKKVRKRSASVPK